MEAESLPSNSYSSWATPKGLGRSEGRCFWEGQETVGTAEAGHEQEPGQLGLKAGHRLMQGPGLKEPQSGTSGAVMGRAPQEPLPFF